MTGLSVLIRKEFQEQLRTMRLPIVAVLFLAFGLLSPILARYTAELVSSLAPSMKLELPTPTMADSIDQVIKNLGANGAFVAVILAMGLVASEKERGTAAFLVTRPAGRAAFLTAKLVAVAATLGVSMAAGGVAAYVYTIILFTAPPIAGYAAMCVLVWLSLVALASVTLLGSTLARSIAPAAGFGFGAWVILSIISALPTIGAFTPSGLFGPARALAIGGDAGDVVGPVIANVALVFVPLGLAWLSFRRQEL